MKSAVSLPCSIDIAKFCELVKGFKRSEGKPKGLRAFRKLTAMYLGVKDSPRGLKNGQMSLRPSQWV